MTDLEMTRLCAEALEIVHWSDTPIDNEGNYWVVISGAPLIYDPFQNDAQAMALEDWLIERGELSFTLNGMGYFSWAFGQKQITFQYVHKDKAARRRAIVECVAKMWAAK